MTDLAWQTLVYLPVAFLLGLLLGWWLGSRKLHDRLERLEKKWRLKYKGRREVLAECREELETCQANPDAQPCCRNVPLTHRCRTPWRTAPRADGSK